MNDSIAQMSRDEFRQMIETVVEQKLLELLGDPDEYLQLRQAVRKRLERQQQTVAAGDRGRALDEVATVRETGQRWAQGFFEQIRIDDPAFCRPEQGQIPPRVR